MIPFGKRGTNHAPAAPTVHVRWFSAAVLSLACTTLWAFQPTTPATDTIALSELPPQGRKVMRLIESGGPFPYDKDGVVFGNRERQLPKQKRGYYREYTVPTPGLKHRGARRIVCGGEEVRAPEACYYTEDHYASFRLIVKGL